jgi:hypothetical protein
VRRSYPVYTNEDLKTGQEKQLEDSGYMNTAVLPVATFEAQTEIISKVLGPLSRVWKACLSKRFTNLCLLVVDQDEDAIATLSVIGIIAIDEATYVLLFCR